MVETRLDEDYYGEFYCLALIVSSAEIDPAVARQAFLELKGPRKYRDIGYPAYPVTDENRWRVDELDRLADEVNGYINQRQFPVDRLAQIEIKVSKLVYG